MNKKPIITMLILLGLAGVSLSACNTAKGFGKDIEKAGESIQNM